MIWVTCLCWAMICLLVATARLCTAIDPIGIVLFVIGCADLIVGMVFWWHDEGRFFD